MLIVKRFLLVLVLIASSVPCFASGSIEHEVVGAVGNANAKRHAKSMIASPIVISLEQEGPWVDCVTNVKDVEDMRYGAGCSLSWDQEGPSEKYIEAFADKNLINCTGRTDANPYRKQYRFTDVVLSAPNPAFKLAEPGKNEPDGFQAILAAVDVLQAKPTRAPLIKAVDHKGALPMPADLVGELHQPLHAGAIYLKDDGHESAATTSFTSGVSWMPAGRKTDQKAARYAAHSVNVKAKQIVAEASISLDW